MRFKTIIKLTADGKNKCEALELVEEYLAGNIVSGVDMKCVTKPVYSKARMAGIVAVSLVVIVGIFVSSSFIHSQNILQTKAGLSAVQAPLRTSMYADKDLKFKKEWQDRQIKQALVQIKRVE